MANTFCTIGKNIRIKGELEGDEDLIIEGTVEGTINLKKHLTVEETGVVRADITTEDLTVKGEVVGNTNASKRVVIEKTAKVVGDIKTSKLVIADGARFKGSVDMKVNLPPDI